MNSAIKDAFLRGALLPFLGAGASMNARTRAGTPLPDAESLAKLLAERAGAKYEGESLPLVYASANRRLGDQLWTVLEEYFKHCTPSAEYVGLASYPWPRIYTLNIDDALDKALQRNSKQKLNFRYRFDRVVDRQPFFDELDVVKLNGAIERQSDGLIFSPQEYARGAAEVPLWYEEAARDFCRYTMLFVGTRLNEPLFFHQIERFRAATGARLGTSYVLVPQMTSIQRDALAEYGLEHLPGSLGDFVTWLKREFPNPPSAWDIAQTVYPQLKVMPKKEDPSAFASLFESLTPVDHALLSSTPNRPNTGGIRDFYRGFKPAWKDILDGVPAELKGQKELLASLKEATNTSDAKLFVLHGPAGSGKTTSLMQTALMLHQQVGLPVYYLSQPIQNLKAVVEALEESVDGRYVLFVDRLSLVGEQLRELLSGDRATKLIVVAGERQNRWRSLTRTELARWLTAEFRLSIIDKSEATSILEKLQQFGPWFRLGKLPKNQRLDELLKKSRQQLLIGLLEATLGLGFEKIIQSDYEALADNDQRRFLAIVGLATVNRLSMPDEIASRAVDFLGISSSISVLAADMSGVIYKEGSSLFARHPVYVERLFQTVVPRTELVDCIKAVLRAYTVYPAPLMRNIKRPAARLFRLLFGHAFLKEILKGDAARVLEVYEAFERDFQQEGLYWLQYGLALRDFDKQEEALEKLKAAVTVYPFWQTEHAYAQQLLILAARSKSKTAAATQLKEAQSLLERLDEMPREIVGAYPIVTLSEHHVEVTLRHHGKSVARQVAKDYANRLQRHVRESPHNARLKKAWQRLSTFAVAGSWDFSLEDQLH